MHLCSLVYTVNTNIQYSIGCKDAYSGFVLCMYAMWRVYVLYIHIYTYVHLAKSLLSAYNYLCVAILILHIVP